MEIFMRSLLLFVILFCCLKGISQSSDTIRIILSHSQVKEGWIFVSEATNGDKHYIRNFYEDKTQNTMKLWTKVIKKKEVLNSKLYYNVKMICLEEYDCIGKKNRTFNMTNYDSKGGVIDNYEWQEDESNWHSLVPESIGEAVLNYICESL